MRGVKIKGKGEREGVKSYDVTFVGHMCFDEIHPFGCEAKVAPGSAVLCGAMAAKGTGKKVLVVTRLAEKDRHLLELFSDKGIDCRFVPADETTYSVVVHNSANLDERELYLKKSAGFFEEKDFPDVETKHVHLAGISNREFTMGFIRDLRKRGFCLSTDMQSFVRQVDEKTREIHYRDVPQKKEIAKQMDKLKLDLKEAEILTGTRDLEEASAIVSGWGCNDVVITHSEGVIARAGEKTFYERFTNRNSSGRTGRGDTTFGAYLARRLDHNVPESLKFAAALVSIKMESPGPFSGCFADVMARMENGP